jgi:hypothetical protein
MANYHHEKFSSQYNEHQATYLRTAHRTSRVTFADDSRHDMNTRHSARANARAHLSTIIASISQCRPLEGMLNSTIAMIDNSELIVRKAIRD